MKVEFSVASSLDLGELQERSREANGGIRALSEIRGADPAVITAGGRWGHRAQSRAGAWLAKPGAQASSCLLSSPEPRSGPGFSAEFSVVEHATQEGCDSGR